MQRPSLLHGIYGGLLGGLVFAGIMVINGTMSMGMLTLPLIGSLVGHPSAWIGFLIHMLNSGIIGAGYVVVFGRLEKGMVDGLHYGMLYGLIWWFLGEMTLMPLVLGLEVGSQWTLTNAFRLLPSLIGHLVYGAILGMTVGAFRDASLPVPEEAGDGQISGDSGAAEAEDPAPLAEPRRPARPLFFRRRDIPGTKDPAEDG